jgi:hypothetical protein
MNWLPISLTTVGSAAEEIVDVPNNRQYVLKYISAYKDSTFYINISIENSRGYRTVFAETLTGGGTIVFNDPIVLNGGDRLVSQSSSAGIDINASFEVNSYVG